MDNKNLSALTSESVEKLFAYVKANRNCNMRTNSYFTPLSLLKLAQEKTVTICIGTQCAIILVFDEDNIVRLYYYAQNITGFTEINSLLPDISNCKLVCDVVGREEKLLEQIEELSVTGLRKYAIFQRMFCKIPQIDTAVDITDVELAIKTDARVVHILLHEVFDPLTARIPNVDDIVRRIVDKEVLVVRKNYNIVACSIFDSYHKQNALLDYIVVKDGYRRKGLGKKMLQCKWQKYNDSKTYYLWINKECSGEIISHRKNGFVEDGMLDYIMVK